MSGASGTVVHATAIALGRHGLLITGAPGAGKSTLAWTLIEEERARGGFAALVADDRAHLDPAAGRLVARSIEATAGLIEIRGAGLFHAPFQAAVVLTHAIALEDDAPRLPEAAERSVDLAGVRLPRIAFRPRVGGLAASVRAALSLRPLAD